MTHVLPSTPTPARIVASTPRPAPGTPAVLAVVLAVLVLAGHLVGAVSGAAVVLVVAAGLTTWLTIASTTGSGM